MTFIEITDFSKKVYFSLKKKKEKKNISLANVTCTDLEACHNRSSLLVWAYPGT
jgi:hypothetical protein